VRGCALGEARFSVAVRLRSRSAGFVTLFSDRPRRCSATSCSAAFTISLAAVRAFIGALERIDFLFNYFLGFFSYAGIGSGSISFLKA
jgi:hypothetical protein